jgi:hypothetical protein
MFGKSEKTDKIQRFEGDSSQEEHNMTATMKPDAHKREKENRDRLHRKYFL